MRYPPVSASVRNAPGARAFHEEFYGVQMWRSVFWRGHMALKCPLDLWQYQEIIHEVKPDLVVELGTYMGGTALFLADILEIAGKGRVVSIDIEAQPDRPAHPRLAYVLGSSVDRDLARTIVSGSRRVLVLADSDHSEAHVLKELDLWSVYVTLGSYLIVEDTNLNGHPVVPDAGPGPWEAVKRFLAGNPLFEADVYRERFGVTFNPSGYLRRTR